MWCIIGHRVEHDYGYGGYKGTSTHTEGVVATFDTEQMAEDYLEKSKLKQPKYRHKYRSSSLCSSWDNCCVEEYISEYNLWFRYSHF